MAYAPVQLSGVFPPHVLAEYEALEKQLRETNDRLRLAITNLHQQIETNIDDANVAAGRDRSDNGRG